MVEKSVSADMYKKSGFYLFVSLIGAGIFYSLQYKGMTALFLIAASIWTIGLMIAVKQQTFEQKSKK